MMRDEAQLALGAGQLEPEPPPEAEFVLRGKEPEHFRRRRFGRRGGIRRCHDSLNSILDNRSA